MSSNYKKNNLKCCVTFQIEDYLKEEVALSLFRDYDPNLLETPNDGVVTVVDSIQSTVSFLSYYFSHKCNKGGKIYDTYNSYTTSKFPVPATEY